MKKQNLLFILLFIILGISTIFFLKIKKEELTNAKFDFSLQEDDLLVDKDSIGGNGLEFGHSGRIWLNALDGFSKVYNGLGEVVKTKDEKENLVPLVVKVPDATGIVFVDSSDPKIFMKDAFVFVAKTGKIYGWHKLANGIEPLEATLRIDNSKSNASYSGITFGKINDKEVIYVADSKNNKIDIYDEDYKKVGSSPAFIDKSLGENFVVTNVKNINDLIYVVYTDKAKQSGAVNIFDLEGNLIKRLITGGYLNNPWGITQVHGQFGIIGGKLLIGNRGNGKINIYEPTTGKYIGTVGNGKGQDLIINGLMSLTNGTNNGAGKVDELFFSADDNSRGAVFGKLQIILTASVPPTSEEKQEPLTNEDKVRADFVTGNFSKIDFNNFEKNLNKDCLKDCLSEKLNKKNTELDATYNKIFRDAQIILAEFAAQGKFQENGKNLQGFLNQLKNLDPKKFRDFTENFCDINANNFFAGDKLIYAKDECVLYKTTQWLNELYTLRSQYIRVELGPLGAVEQSGEKIKNKAFKDLIDEEEARINKQY